MLFNSLTFLFGFLPLLLALYFIVESRKIKNIILLLFSILFYAWGEPKYIFLMLITIIVVYVFGLLIDKFDRDKNKLLKKISLIICIILVVGNLIFFKYTNFFIENINNIFNSNIKILSIIICI